MLDQQDTATTDQTAVIGDDPLAEPATTAGGLDTAAAPSDLPVAAEPAAADPSDAVVAPAVGGRHREERLRTDPHAYRFDVAGPTRGRRHGVVGVVASATTWLTKPVKM